MTGVSAGDGNTEGGPPVPVVETAASGMGGVAARDRDISAMIRDGETGRLAEGRDSEHLANRRARPIEDPAARPAPTPIDARPQGLRLAPICREFLG